MKLKMLPPPSTPLKIRCTAYTLHRPQPPLSVWSSAIFNVRRTIERGRTGRVATPFCLLSFHSLFVSSKPACAPFFLLLPYRTVLAARHPPTNPLVFELSFFLRGLSLLLFLCSFAFQPGSRINTVFAARFYANVIRLFAICPGKFCRRRFRLTLIGAHAFLAFPYRATNASIP